MTPNPTTFWAAGWPEPDVLHEGLQNWAAAMAESEPRLVRVGYLQIDDDSTGSGEGSHLNLILLMRECDVPLAERVTMWDLGAVPVPAQTLVYTLDEWSEVRAADTPMGRKQKDIRWVYER